MADITMSLDDTLELDAIIEEWSSPDNVITDSDNQFNINGIQTNTGILNPKNAGEHKIVVNGQELTVKVTEPSTIPDVQTDQIEVYLKSDYLDDNYTQGDVISKWTGVANGFTVGDSSNGSNPTVETNLANGFAGANLSGDAHLTSSGFGGESVAYDDNTAYTQIFVAVKQSSGTLENFWSPDDGDPNKSEWNDSSSPWDYHPRSPNVGYGGHHGWGSEPDFSIGISNSDFTVGKPFIWTHRYDGSDTYDVRINEGLYSGSDTSSTHGSHSSKGYHVIGTSVQKPIRHKADIYWIESGLWTTRLNDSEVQQVESDLVSKFNIDTSSL